MDAANAGGIRAALQTGAAPSVNHVYADTGGNIGWIAAGRTPIRPNWDGLLPVPGDGRYEWAGFHPRGDLPKSVNPAKGFFATANEMNLPADYPATAAQGRVRMGGAVAHHADARGAGAADQP